MRTWDIALSSPEALLSAARAARECAYAPYSRFRVGAALLDAEGRVFVGCNVENASYGLTICAERNAVGAWVVGKGAKPLAVAVVGLPDEPCTPCGACRQVLVEFNPSLIVVVEGGGNILLHGIGELLPHAIPLQEFLLEKP